VRIWNNDSCSVVRPIKVNVQPLPQFLGVGSTPTACGENTGSAIAVAQNTTPLPLSYSINGAPFAFSSTYTGNFANLSAGANTIILRDAFGCETDTVIQIGVTNTTNAFFTATPNSGAAPLSVSFTNQSTNATNYSWFIESDFQGDNLLQHTFDTSGSYTVTLIAWQNDPLCADTFSIQILVYDSLIIQIPNVFTPNGDGINDLFTITTNQPVSVEYQLFNRWGNVIAQDTKPTAVGNSNFLLPIWDGAGYSDETYFYVIRAVHDGKEYEFDGFLERIE
jgi:gliding motility-associated-like protein